MAHFLRDCPMATSSYASHATFMPTLFESLTTAQQAAFILGVEIDLEVEPYALVADGEVNEHNLILVKELWKARCTRLTEKYGEIHPIDIDMTEARAEPSSYPSSTTSIRNFFQPPSSHPSSTTSLSSPPLWFGSACTKSKLSKT